MKMELLADHLTRFSPTVIGCVTPGQARAPLSLSSLMGNAHYSEPQSACLRYNQHLSKSRAQGLIFLLPTYNPAGPPCRHNVATCAPSVFT